MDGFSVKPFKQPRLPNGLFFGAPQEVALSNAYGDSSDKSDTSDACLKRLLSWDEDGYDFAPAEVERLIGAVVEHLLPAQSQRRGRATQSSDGRQAHPTDHLQRSVCLVTP